MPIELPCGQCIGCRLERSRQWALRCIHEASLYDDNCYITLTYDNDHIPQDHSVDIRHYQLFMKRLRKKYYPKTIRFFHCGEYGEKNGRPHYHAILFNHRFDDLELVKEKPNKLYTSETLAKLWGKGFVTIGEVTFESAAYVARYITKKINGDKADEHYTYINEETGEFNRITPEYISMSRRPGIGSEFFTKYRGDMYPSDYITVRGKKLKPTKFYDSKLENVDSEMHRNVISSRKSQARARKADNTLERLRAKEIVKKSQFKQLKRSYEND